MSGYTDEHIFNYLDQALTAEQLVEFEKQMNKDPELKDAVEQLRTSNEYFLNNQLISAPRQLSDKVMTQVKALSRDPYYRPSGLFSNTSFLLISGVLTALVAFVSIIQGGYLDLQSILPTIAESGYFKQWSLESLVTKQAISNTMMVIYGVLALALLDRFVLNPFFRKKPKSLGLN